MSNRVLIMNAKNRIKIVKRTETGSAQNSRDESAQAESQPKATQKVARQVAAWVKEFQQRQVQEQGRSFASLFQRA